MTQLTLREREYASEVEVGTQYLRRFPETSPENKVEPQSSNEHVIGLVNLDLGLTHLTQFWLK